VRQNIVLLLLLSLSLLLLILPPLLLLQERVGVHYDTKWGPFDLLLNELLTGPVVIVAATKHLAGTAERVAVHPPAGTHGGDVQDVVSRMPWGVKAVRNAGPQPQLLLLWPWSRLGGSSSSSFSPSSGGYGCSSGALEADLC
jgi:hypothetical protein